ncbi:hypothetical protein [Ureibacillus acetophenoni]|uniref:hypothetical protein n=1 Tax=Ureibacillus acetophenoni TaxID=614649 RepID=UPI000BE365A2|nr:hypothetical protein [Ureibacillus acetophenoni]
MKSQVARNHRKVAQKAPEVAHIPAKVARKVAHKLPKVAQKAPEFAHNPAKVARKLINLAHKHHATLLI